MGQKSVPRRTDKLDQQRYEEQLPFLAKEPMPKYGQIQTKKKITNQRHYEVRAPDNVKKHLYFLFMLKNINIREEDQKEWDDRKQCHSWASGSVSRPLGTVFDFPDTGIKNETVPCRWWQSVTAVCLISGLWSEPVWHNGHRRGLAPSVEPSII